MHNHLYKTPITMSFNPTAVACSHLVRTPTAPFDSPATTIHKTTKDQPWREVSEGMRAVIRFGKHRRALEEAPRPTHLTRSDAKVSQDGKYDTPLSECRNET